jgi:transposase
MDLCGNTVRCWINRFNARGLDGLEEDVRTGRPLTYSVEQRGAVITAALTRPTELGLPFACWTLDPSGGLSVGPGHRHAPQPDQ